MTTTKKDNAMMYYTQYQTNDGTWCDVDNTPRNAGAAMDAGATYTVTRLRRAAMILAAICAGMVSTPDMAMAGDSDHAWVACETALENALTDPDSLEYEGRRVIEPYQGGHLVSRYFRSRNGFGGMVRQAYVCSADGLRVRDLQIVRR